MSRGNPVVTVRFPPPLLAEVEAAVAKSVHTRPRAEPWTRTEFLLAAVREKLAHMKRSNRRRDRRPAREDAT